MKFFPENPFFRNLTVFDKRILKVFFITLIFAISFGIILFLIVKPSIEAIGSYFVFNTFLIFSLTGILATYIFSKDGIISTKKIVKGFAKISLVFGFLLEIIIVLVIFIDGDFPENTVELIAMWIILYFGMFLASLTTLLAFLVFGFGIISVMVAVERGMAPEMLLHVTRITKNTTDEMKKKDIRSYLAYSGLRWVFNIPEAVDTQNLKINRGRPFTEFPWTTLRNALIWQFIFGTLIVIYISFNPFYLEEYTFQELFNTASQITIFVPYLVLPWFLYLRLDARSKGHAKDFNLYNGRRTRMTQSFMTLGTILIIIRLGIEKVDIQAQIGTFVIYYFFFFITTFLFSFVFFNYFENDLARDVARSYKKIKD